MNQDPEPIVSSDTFDKYGLNERCRVSRERVQDFVDRDLMSEEKLSERLISAQRSEQPTVIEAIRASFQCLRDPESGRLCPDLFEQQITYHLHSLSVTFSEETSKTLLSVLSFHAFHPFPQSPRNPGITEDAFIRAICLLTLSPFPYQGPTAPATHRYSSGTWGPHRGRYIALRGKSAPDFLRRVFRNLAQPYTCTTPRTSVTTIPIPRFEYYAPLAPEEGSGERGGEYDDELGTEMVVVEHEREVHVDVIDVLSECPPEEDRLTANPFRESYQIVLSSLRGHKEDLAELFVPTARLVGLMQVILAMQGVSMPGCEAATERLGRDGKMGWKEFDGAMAEHSGLLADGFAKIFGVFAVAKT